ncbi:MAG TPA: PcfJ domain-containing protein [Candidatus Intestinimonas stercorigallinarum]|nr:PcfJ domain-containing protein [Candidatus Intestinimonas stercorigallinarum]
MREQISRDPPEGFLEWAARELAGELDTFGFLYEQEWAEDWGLEQLLDEWAKPRKRRMVRVECSCCGYRDLYHYGRDYKAGYGFVLPESYTEVEGGTIYGDGENILCPQCGTPVLIRKRADVRKKGYFVTSEARAMSASLVGKDRLLAITCWVIQRQAGIGGGSRLAAIPAEAYVFSPTECAQLMGWVNGYSGAGGYFIQYTRAWRQPKGWRERWGQEEHIFGLTPELVAASCLPHCKLDVYMAERPGVRHYPVAWLRLYQEHSNAETVLIHGLPRVLDDLLRKRNREDLWEKNVKGLPELPELDWSQTRPAQILGLTKDELRLGREQDWGMLYWDLYRRSKAAGEVLTGQDIVNAFYLGDDHVGELVGQGPVSRSIRYLLEQCGQLEGAYVPEPEDEDPPPDAVIPDVQTLIDYWTMAGQLGWDLTDSQLRFPHNLMAAHDEVAAEVAKLAEAGRAQLFRLRRKQLARWSFAWGDMVIRPAASQKELTDEGNSLHHCVSRYGKDHAEGRTAIFFVRRRSKPKESYYTLELDERKLVVRQNRGLRNCPRTPEVLAFEELWLGWVRSGAHRDQRGKPVVQAVRQEARTA